MGNGRIDNDVVGRGMFVKKEGRRFESGFFVKNRRRVVVDYECVV